MRKGISSWLRKPIRHARDALRNSAAGRLAIKPNDQNSTNAGLVHKQMLDQSINRFVDPWSSRSCDWSNANRTRIVRIRCTSSRANLTVSGFGGTGRGRAGETRGPEHLLLVAQPTRGIPTTWNRLIAAAVKG
jgi:hypothetical protein